MRRLDCSLFSFEEGAASIRHVEGYVCYDNGYAETPASASTGWLADVTYLGQRSPGQSSQGQMSQSPPRPIAAPSLLVPGVTSQPGAHLRRFDDDVTSHESHDVSPSSNVPSAIDSECRLSSPTTPVAMTCENVSWPALQSASYFSTTTDHQFCLFCILLQNIFSFPHEAGLAGGCIVFSTCPFVRPFRSFVCYKACKHNIVKTNG